jgi:hypothetical protein
MDFPKFEINTEQALWVNPPGVEVRRLTEELTTPVSRLAWIVPNSVYDPDDNEALQAL